jgi:hypothetical protein
MTDFVKDCYFNGFCKGRQNFVPTPRYMRHSAESIFVVEFIRVSPRIRIYMQNRFSPGVQFNEKTEGRKSREAAPLKYWNNRNGKNIESTNRVRKNKVHSIKERLSI